MKKRILALLILVGIFMSLFPAGASASVLKGYTSKVDYENTDPNRYQIVIDLNNQIISVNDLYAGVCVLQSLCTTGNKENPSGPGNYKLGDLKERFGYFVAFGQYAQYWTQVVRGIYIHSIMYDSRDLDSMSKSAYRDLGKAVSHGCIRVLPEIAQWIYYNCPPGTDCRITDKIPKDPILAAQLKSALPAYSDYVQPTDEKASPVEIPAAVKVQDAPLRTGFSSSRDKTLLNLGLNERLMLLQIGRDWCKVRTEAGKLGYVKTQYLFFDPDKAVEYHEAYGATKKTYLYASDSTDSEKLFTLTAGTEVTVTGNPRSGWYSAEYKGVSGYVRTKYVKLQKLVVYPQVDVNSVLVQTESGTQLTTGALSYTRPDAAANLRAEASTQSAILTVLDPSSPVTILRIEGNWYYCSTAEGWSGYLHKSCFP